MNFRVPTASFPSGGGQCPGVQGHLLAGHSGECPPGPMESHRLCSRPPPRPPVREAAASSPGGRAAGTVLPRELVCILISWYRDQTRILPRFPKISTLRRELACKAVPGGFKLHVLGWENAL